LPCFKAIFAEKGEKYAILNQITTIYEDKTMAFFAEKWQKFAKHFPESHTYIFPQCPFILMKKSLT
jgi:hypothetical protein